MDFCNVIALAPAEWLGSPGRSSHPQTLAGGGGVTRRALSEIPTSTSSVPLGDHARLATRSAGGVLGRREPSGHRQSSHLARSCPWPAGKVCLERGAAGRDREFCDSECRVRRDSLLQGRGETTVLPSCPSWLVPLSVTPRLSL